MWFLKNFILFQGFIVELKNQSKFKNGKFVDLHIMNCKHNSL